MVIVKNKTIWRYMKKTFIVSCYPTLLHNPKVVKVNHLECTVFPTHIYRRCTNKNEPLPHTAVENHCVI